jgi:DNA-binding NarL/FixJ family response regulator
MRESAEDDFERVARRALDTMEMGVMVLSADLSRVLHQNTCADALLGGSIPSDLSAAIRAYVGSRRDTVQTPPSVRLLIGDRRWFVRALPGRGAPPVEIVLFHEEILRDSEALCLLRSHGLTPREYQVLAALRQGMTNPQIARKLGISAGTVTRHVIRLLERFDASNRTHLVHRVDAILSQRA